MKTKREAIIVDLDGTLCDNAVRANFKSNNHKDYWPLYEYIPFDKPNKWCVDIMDMADLYGCKIIFLTARPKKYEQKTRDWLIKHLTVVSFSYDLIMMPNDYRYQPPVFKKARIKELNKKYNILFALDDQRANVDVMREEGIMCLHCGND